MTKNQLDRAMTLARNYEVNLLNVDLSTLEGYGLPNFQPVTVTVEMVAAMIRWQCIMFNGEIVAEELDLLVRVFRHKVTILEVV